MQDVNWVEVIAGFLLGLTPLICRQLWLLVNFKRLPGQRKYLGTWYAYHRSTTGSGKVQARKLKVTYSFLLGRMNVRTLKVPGNETMSRLQFSGHISAREGMVRYVTLKDPNSHERLTWYLFDQFLDPLDHTFGLYLALDLRGLPAAGAMMISRSPASPEEYERLSRHVVRIAAMLDGSDDGALPSNAMV
ncbi:hypothetical protein BWI15_07855 [Kribbella sp. ALI-6-A]|uniref:hypothetical protein n=1 Tax=Kribbella sp. ALI-6-A TaxID=1933817 RepID=UPI00097CB44A|nr:hypothetical protein [Kribbella sp. ALI-6-A]ONI75731.1 hypothetical protein BWI15_07855 [Kribbella sp. ALI-6-A]